MSNTSSADSTRSLPKQPSTWRNLFVCALCTTSIHAAIHSAELLSRLSEEEPEPQPTNLAQQIAAITPKIFQDAVEPIHQKILRDIEYGATQGKDKVASSVNVCNRDNLFVANKVTEILRSEGFDAETGTLFNHVRYCVVEVDLSNLYKVKD